MEYSDSSQEVFHPCGSLMKIKVNNAIKHKRFIKIGGAVVIFSSKTFVLFSWILITISIKFIKILYHSSINIKVTHHCVYLQ